MKLVLRDTMGRLPTSSYDLLDATGAVVGYSQLRHRPSRGEHLPLGAESNIYYEVFEPYRRRGYGRKQLALLLDEARAIGLERVRVGADFDNVASRRIIEANGGRLIARFTTENDDVQIYEIALA